MAFKYPFRPASDPWLDAFSITPDNNVDLTYWARGLRAAVAGDIVVVMATETNVANTHTFTVAAGEFVPVAVRRVKSTGTTATGIKGGH